MEIQDLTGVPPKRRRLRKIGRVRITGGKGIPGIFSILSSDEQGMAAYAITFIGPKVDKKGKAQKTDGIPKIRQITYPSDAQLEAQEAAFVLRQPTITLHPYQLDRLMQALGELKKKALELGLKGHEYE
jgi:hypothetical protein